ncbi:hypothetical protein ACLM5H_21450 [Fredinandcohnia humi]
MIDWILNSWVGIVLVAVVPFILFTLSSNTSKKIRKDIEGNPYDHRNNPPPSSGM